MTEKTVHIRRMPTEEMLEAMFPLTSYAFQASPPLPDKEEWQEIVRKRKDVTYFALFEDDAAVASVASSLMTQQVRGKIYDVGGVWGVATDPAARRKGYCKHLMARLMAADREGGRPLSVLHPFRESFYERLGYVTFPFPRTARFKPSALMPLLKKDLGGKIELVLIGDGYDAYQDYLYKLQQRVHGLAIFVHGRRAQAQENRSWLALAKVGGQVVGLLLYHLKGDDVGDFVLRAYRFYYDTSQAKYLLLQWLARHTDQAAEVELWLPPFEQPETWLSDFQATTESVSRAPMGRVLDVARIGGMQIGPGQFTARISDPCCPWNEGSWRFQAVDGELQIEPADRADCDLTIQALAALIYGTHNPADFVYRDWGNPSLAVQSTMQTMFPPMLPHIHEVF